MCTLRYSDGWMDGWMDGWILFAYPYQYREIKNLRFKKRYFYSPQKNFETKAVTKIRISGKFQNNMRPYGDLHVTYREDIYSVGHRKCNTSKKSIPQKWLEIANTQYEINCRWLKMMLIDL
jgi:hypothetical protein